jgi:hypothetical protein
VRQGPRHHQANSSRQFHFEAESGMRVDGNYAISPGVGSVWVKLDMEVKVKG